MDIVKLRLTLDLETNGETDAEELGWILNLLRFELAHWPRWRGKVRRVDILNPREPGGRASSAEERQMELAFPSPP